MINLLPPEMKKEIRAGRHNVLLARFTVINLISITILAIIVGGAYVVMNIARTTAQAQQAEATARIASYRETKKAAEQFKANLATAKEIKTIQIRYSDALIKIAQALPSGVTLKSLKLSPETVGKPMEIELTADSYEESIPIKESFQKSDLFSDVKFVSLSGSTVSSRAVDVVMSITIDKKVLQ